VIGPVPVCLRDHIIQTCGPDASPLELRLAGAWVMQRLGHDESEADIMGQLVSKPWRRRWWRKERVSLALLQVSSLASQQHDYFGWETMLQLAGGNISAFLLLCSDIWDEAAKMGYSPADGELLPREAQSRGARSASSRWATRDRDETSGGRERYEVVQRLAQAIAVDLVGELTMSNPGHSGFSLAESALVGTPEGEQVREFLDRAVNWAILEERRHTSKLNKTKTRRKWYLHPMLSPYHRVPYKRVKEPFYVDVGTVYRWLFTTDTVRFRSGKQSTRRSKAGSRDQLVLEGVE